MAFIFSILLNPIMRNLYIRLGMYDIPGEIKTHRGMIPHSGGVAVFISFVISLLIIRFMTHFPSGTLRELRYITLGAGVVFLMGLIDDIKKPGGIRAEVKFVMEVIIASFMVLRGFKINFISPDYIAYILSVLWIVGITNAINIIDIMDGLSSSQIIIASFAFYFITLPQEELYVNLLAGILGFSVLGFMPFNMSKRLKIFLGDSGSLFCGFILAVISLGARYSETNPLAVYSPLFILSVAIFDTLYVSYMRIKRGMSPFKGSKDHFAIRLEMMGYSRIKIVILTSVFLIIMSFFSFFLTKVGLGAGIFMLVFVTIFLFYVAKYLSSVRII
ncbi:MAG: MraY family glycosyltransferase [Elusimicrobiales bacterium]